MSQKLSNKTQERLANLISQACLFGHTKNDFDLYKTAQSIVVLYIEFGIRLPSFSRAREILDELQNRQTQEA